MDQVLPRLSSPKCYDVRVPKVSPGSQREELVL